MDTEDEGKRREANQGKIKGREVDLTGRKKDAEFSWFLGDGAEGDANQVHFSLSWELLKLLTSCGRRKNDNGHQDF